MASQRQKALAKALMDLTWEEMDELAEQISYIAYDREGLEPTDERYIAKGLLDTARDVLNDDD